MRRETKGGLTTRILNKHIESSVSVCTNFHLEWTKKRGATHNSCINRADNNCDSPSVPSKLLRRDRWAFASSNYSVASRFFRTGATSR
jgi:hypothetical protein